MKKTITITIALLSFFNSFAQVKDEAITQNDTLYNKWSIELNAGFNKPIRPFTTGYYQDFNGINHIDLGTRYMFNSLFGLKVDFAFDKLQNKESSGSLPFKNDVYRIDLQTVYNLGSLFKFNSFSNRLGLLAHAGIQGSLSKYSSNYKEVIIGPPPPPDPEPLYDSSEYSGGFILGITPQFRISNRFALTADVTLIKNISQPFNWDGYAAAENNNFSGVMYTMSFGLTAYLGKHEKHADWINYEMPSIDQEARKRLNDIEELMNDVDSDGVPDYLDVQNNTPNGVKVDTKGRFIDLNGNTIPDELEAKSEVVINNNRDRITVLKELIENGLINIYFDFNQVNPNAGSTNNIYIFIEYFKAFPNAKVLLKGYADERGNANENLILSTKRAQKVKELLISNSISPDRISIEGLGVDQAYDNSLKTGQDLSRRVSLKIEH